MCKNAYGNEVIPDSPGSGRLPCWNLWVRWFRWSSLWFFGGASWGWVEHGDDRLVHGTWQLAGLATPAGWWWRGTRSGSTMVMLHGFVTRHAELRGLGVGETHVNIKHQRGFSRLIVQLHFSCRKYCTQPPCTRIFRVAYFSLGEINWENGS